jgi:hypothetical protein
VLALLVRRRPHHIHCRPQWILPHRYKNISKYTQGLIAEEQVQEKQESWIESRHTNQRVVRLLVIVGYIIVNLIVSRMDSLKDGHWRLLPLEQIQTYGKPRRDSQRVGDRRGEQCD